MALWCLYPFLHSTTPIHPSLVEICSHACVAIPTMAPAKLPVWCHWTRGWEGRVISGVGSSTCLVQEQREGAGDGVPKATSRGLGELACFPLLWQPEPAWVCSGLDLVSTRFPSGLCHPQDELLNGTLFLSVLVLSFPSARSPAGRHRGFQQGWGLQRGGKGPPGWCFCLQVHQLSPWQSPGSLSCGHCWDGAKCCLLCPALNKNHHVGLWHLRVSALHRVGVSGVS